MTSVDHSAGSWRRIDMHMHAITPAYLAAFARATGMDSVFGASAWSADKHLAVMDRYETALSLISVPPPGVFFGDASAAAELARETNEEYARLLDAFPGRFAALGCVPLPDVDATLAEIDYALSVLELDGIGLFSNVAGIYLGAPELDPVLAELDRREAFVFVHPAPPVHVQLAHYPIWLVELPFDMTRTIVDLLYSGALHRYPRIRYLFPHLGGATPFLAHRLATLVKRDTGWAQAAPEGPLTYLARLAVDSAQADNPPALDCVRAFVSETKIVYGSDWPYAVLGPGPDPQPGLAHLGDRARAAIEWDHALALMPELRPRLRRS